MISQKKITNEGFPYSPEKIIQPHLFNIFNLKHDFRTFVERMSQFAFTHFYGPNRSGCLDLLKKFQTYTPPCQHLAYPPWSAMVSFWFNPLPPLSPDVICERPLNHDHLHCVIQCPMDRTRNTFACFTMHTRISTRLCKFLQYQGISLRLMYVIHVCGTSSTKLSCIFRNHINWSSLFLATTSHPPGHL